MFLFTLDSSNMPEIINGVEVKYDSDEFSSLIFKQRQYKEEGSVFGFQAEDTDGKHILWVVPSSEGKAKLIIKNADGDDLIDTLEINFAEMENKILTIKWLLNIAMYAYFKWSEKVLGEFQGFSK